MSSKSFSLRQPRATDGYALNQLVKRCPPLDTNSVYCNLLQCSDFSATSIAAENNTGELVGFISGYCPPARPDTLFVWQVAVDDRMRGQGLAISMLLELIQRTAADGVRWLETTISPGNTASEALFAKAFRQLNVEPETCVLFSRATHFDGQHDDEVLYRAGPFTSSALSDLSKRNQESA
ncbi:MAG: diaminobutyrate acetyltransferase [Pseudomonas sp.]